MAVYGPYPATVVSEHDGDTCKLAFDLGFHITLEADVRTYGDNAAETGTAKGAEATAYAAQLMPLGTKVTVYSHELDKYGRVLGDIILPDGTHFVADMIAAGEALPYFGKGPKPV